MNGIERYRISSIEPNLITEDVIEIVKESTKFMPHFHIPLQSGSDTILKKMRRKYKTKLYREKIQSIHNSIQDVCIGADVIVGFPGESNKEFNETLKFIKALPISYLHVFPYSARENTLASDFDNQVENKVKAERSRQLIILSQKIRNDFYQRYINTEHTVLFEQKNNQGMLYGFTDNYIKVKIPFREELCQLKTQVSLLAIDKDGIMKASLIK